MKIFLDTSALIAYYNADDKYHAQAVEVMEEIKRGEIPFSRFYVTDYVFDETVTFVECILKNHELALSLGDALQTSPLTTIIRIDEDTFNESWERFKQYKGFSFTDCASLQAVKRHNIDSVLTFDEHFRKVSPKTIP